MIITDCIFSPQFDVFDILFEDPFRISLKIYSSLLLSMFKTKHELKQLCGRKGLKMYKPLIVLSRKM